MTDNLLLLLHVVIEQSVSNFDSVVMNATLNA